MERVPLHMWMTYLSPEWQRKPISELLLPGTHDSAAYQILDQVDILESGLTYWTGKFDSIPLVEKVLKNWTLTQNLNLVQQFDCGIREFDLRLSCLEGNPQCFVFSHSYACEIAIPSLVSLASKIRKYPKEIVLLTITHDARNKHLLTQTVIDDFIQQLITNLGRFMVPNRGNLRNLSLQDIYSTRKQIILNYAFASDNPLIWRIPYRQFEEWTCSVERKLEIIDQFSETLVSKPPSLKDSKLVCVTLTLTPDDQCIKDALKRLDFEDGVFHMHYRNRNTLMRAYEEMNAVAKSKINIIETDFADPSIVRWILNFHYGNKNAFRF